MSDLKLYRINGTAAVELASVTAKFERDLQRIVEMNMEQFFGVRLLASEFSTGMVHRGRMDSIGIDENSSPVIFEYKRNASESVINQGLFYLDWLLDHQADFKLLVLEKFGQAEVENIDFSSPRLICVANDFTRYDEHAIRQMGRSIELIRYQQFDGELIAFEQVAKTTEPGHTTDTILEIKPTRARLRTNKDDLEKASQSIRDLYERLCREIDSMGDDITSKWNKHYRVYRRLKNFASIQVLQQSQKLLVFVKVNLSEVDMDASFMRDVSQIGHMGTGNLELTVTSAETLAKALPFIQVSYETN